MSIAKIQISLIYASSCRQIPVKATIATAYGSAPLRPIIAMQSADPTCNHSSQKNSSVEAMNCQQVWPYWEAKHSRLPILFTSRATVQVLIKTTQAAASIVYGGANSAIPACRPAIQRNTYTVRGSVSLSVILLVKTSSNACAPTSS